MKKIILLISILGFTKTLFAQDARTWRASVGVGAAFKKNMRVNNRYEDLDKDLLFKTIPFIEGNYRRLSIGPSGISVRAVGNQLINASVFIKRDGDRYLGAGMGPRKDSQFVGVSAKFIKYGLSVSHDISGRSKGYLVNANYGELFPMSESFILRAGLSLEWADDRYAEYYYSVRKTEATADRKEHHLNSYLQPGINFMPIYKFNPRLSFVTAVSFKLVPKDVRNSPTMNGDKIDIGGILGINYAL